MSNKRRRRAATNAKLAWTLAFVLIAGGAFWSYRLKSSRPPPAPLRKEYELWCSQCKDKLQIPVAEATGRPRNEDGKVLCPKCGTYSGSWGPPARIGNLVGP